MKRSEIKPCCGVQVQLVPADELPGAFSAGINALTGDVAERRCVKSNRRLRCSSGVVVVVTN